LIVNLLQAIILGIVQGITEFFPISSSAHLQLARYFLHLPNSAEFVYFDLACHLGTWLALVYFLRRDVWQILRDPRKIALYTVALLPLVPMYLLLKPLRASLLTTDCTGYFLLVTSMLLFFASKASLPHSLRLSSGKEKSQRSLPQYETKKWGNVILIGLSQAFALLPGLSRSGATMATARFCGWSWLEAAKFSFLLSLPTILGGEVLESLKGSPTTVSFTSCAAGLSSSFAVGLGTVRLAFWMYEKNIVKPFAVYCLAAGLFMIAIFR
jgi:undecaprenyl-diphosphatase